MEKKATKKATNYVATIKIYGKLFEANGKTGREAIAKLKVPNAKGRSILTVSHGNTTKERILNSIQTLRLFNTHGISQEVALKNISLMFDGI
jgi:hypothetical protein